MKLLVPASSEVVIEQQESSPKVPSEDEQSSISTSLDTLLEDTYQVPERLTFSELPDLGNNPFWPEIQTESWRAGSTTATADYSSGTSDQNSPASSLIVMSPPQNASTTLPPPPQTQAAAAAVVAPSLHMPPTYLLPPLPPPPHYASLSNTAASTSTEHTRSNSVPADMNFLSYDHSPFSLE